ncbi:Beta-1,4-galactosyltransferase 2 [Takifugu flavidus]|uniref:Beta-1,4-galactosyltransferase 2 n=1 Tax=Takifugu flavidus TaxID=433684 RepID=A0A5C6P2U4_9TELE|nr:Beta-1,4-galactosyltransferase 2 [Takifugu flavidus]
MHNRAKRLTGMIARSCDTYVVKAVLPGSQEPVRLCRFSLCCCIKKHDEGCSDPAHRLRGRKRMANFDSFAGLQSAQRITLNGMKVSRPDVRIGRFRMIKHERDKHNEPNPQRFNKIQNTKNTMKKDGISSLTYRLVQVKKYPLYTNISVEIGKPPPRPFKG